MFLDNNIDEIFTSNKFLSTLKNKERDFFLEKAIEIEYNSKETVFKQKSHVHYVFFLVEGLIKCFIEGDKRKQFIINILTPGNQLGFSQIYDTNYYKYTSIAIKNSICIQIPIDDFKKIIDKNKDLSTQIIKSSCTITQSFYKKVFSLGTKQMHGRLADTILELSTPEYMKEDTISHLSRQDLSDLTGMSKESVIRLLTEFKNDGLIEIDGKSIIINNKEFLERLSRIG